MGDERKTTARVLCKIKGWNLVEIICGKYQGAFPELHFYFIQANKIKKFIKMKR